MADLRRQLAQPSPLRLIDAVASGTNEIDGVAYQAVVPVSAGQRCQLLKQGDAPPVILGPLVTDWQTITLADANWTVLGGRPPQWRFSGGRVELQGQVRRDTSSFSAGSTFFSLGASGNPPVPPADFVTSGYGRIIANTPDGSPLYCIASVSGSVFRTVSTTYALAVNDEVAFDGMWWPA